MYIYIQCNAISLLFAHSIYIYIYMCVHSARSTNIILYVTQTKQPLTKMKRFLIAADTRRNYFFVIYHYVLRMMIGGNQPL